MFERGYDFRSCVFAFKVHSRSHVRMQLYSKALRVVVVYTLVKFGLIVQTGFIEGQY